MSTVFLTRGRIFTFTMAGGGVPGKGAGIVPVTMTPVGSTISTFPLFVQVFPQAGGTTTGSAIGRVIPGTISRSPTTAFRITGGNGRRANIGKRKTTGVSRD